MDIAAVQRELELKLDNSVNIADTVVKDSKLLPALFDALASPKASLKYKAIKILRFISEKSPRTLYPEFDRFEKMLGSNNNIFKWNAIDIIGNLMSVDTGKRFEMLFEKYYELLNECNLITTAHVVTSSAVIIKARPIFEPAITDKLLQVTNLSLPTDECRAIAAGKVIESFSSYYKNSKNKDAMLSFARDQVNSQRPATRKKAELFLKKFGK